MLSPSRSGFAALLFGLLVLAACDDPSGVGLDVTEFGDTDPRVTTMESVFSTDSLRDLTGMHDQDPAALVSQAFSGSTWDPLFGLLDASAYLNFVRPFDLAFQFDDVSVDSVVLHLRPGNIYGDSLGTAQFEIYEVATKWNGQRFPSDTTLEVHNQLVGQFSMSGTDTLVTVQLDEAWVSMRDTTIRSPEFTEQFFGLQIRPSGETPFTTGFTFFSTFTVHSDYLGTGIPIATEFPVENLGSITSLDESTAMAPDYLVPMRDGTGIGLTIDIDPTEYRNQPLTAAYIRLDADTLLLRDGVPSSFVRPLAPTLTLYTVDNGQETAFIQGSYLPARNAYFFQGSGLTNLIQDILLDRSTVDGFRIGFPHIPTTLHYAPVTAHDDHPPRVLLLLVPDGQ